MTLIIGGIGQGKLDYAKRILHLTDEDVAQNPEDAQQKPVVAELSQWIRTHEDARELLDLLIVKNPNVVLICNEVGCGVVPMSTEERQWREHVGRICTYLATKAKCVERIFCGIPMVLKSEDV